MAKQMCTVSRTQATAGVSLALALTLGACAGTGHNTTGPVDVAPLDHYEVTVTETQETLDVMPSGWMLDADTKAALDAFARTYVARGKGKMMMTAPAGAENADIAYETAKAVRAYLRERGVNDAHISAEIVDASGQTNPGISLTFMSTKAEAPECGSFDDMTKSYHNVTSRNFGCATAANLAAMVANPQDLVEPRAMDGGNAERAVMGIEAYRTGNVEASEVGVTSAE